ncbi:hypothetical protein JTE90_023668 [Oedothorax gibbosus]|uniref:Uncharacterized protein n=1 Tax=Oedothorax gibbosus TaxID=931172 RepID=A0AAV6U7X6_9ARAC|nr:hypothetical protein JTE90_023668 [Oedothorax gibbosus]
MSKSGSELSRSTKPSKAAKTSSRICNTAREADYHETQGDLHHFKSSQSFNRHRMSVTNKTISFCQFKKSSGARER